MMNREADAWALMQSLVAPGEPVWHLTAGRPTKKADEQLDVKKVAKLAGVVALGVAAAAVLPFDELPDLSPMEDRLVALTPRQLVVAHVRVTPRVLASPTVDVLLVGRYAPEDVGRLVEGVEEVSTLLVKGVVFALREPAPGERVACVARADWRDNVGQARAIAARVGHPLGGGARTA